MEKILLIGAGPMSVEYAKVLQAQNIEYTVLGRGLESAKTFKEKIGKHVRLESVQALKDSGELEGYTGAIIAVTEDQLGKSTRELIRTKKIENILVEKPGGLSVEDILEVASLAKENDVNVYIGYNRRFYASVQAAKQIIVEDGGVSSFSFEFTEWAHVIGPLKKAEGVKEEWFLANSSHVIDLAFYLGGIPEEMTSYVSGSLEWHPRASIFVGAGRTNKGALFSYSANWEAPGRWGVEILTNKHRLYLRPMEKLQIQNLGEVSVAEVVIADELDQKFKPGLYKQVEAFIKNKDSLLKIEEQCLMLNNYKKIRGNA